MEVQIQLSLLTKFHFNSYIVHSFPSGLFALIIITFLFQNILYATLKKKIYLFIFSFFSSLFCARLDPLLKVARFLVMSDCEVFACVRALTFSQRERSLTRMVLFWWKITGRLRMVK